MVIPLWIDRIWVAVHSQNIVQCGRKRIAFFAWLHLAQINQLVTNLSQVQYDILATQQKRQIRGKIDDSVAAPQALLV
jgi:hypothetical protein